MIRRTVYKRVVVGMTTAGMETGVAASERNTSWVMDLPCMEEQSVAGRRRERQLCGTRRQQSKEGTTDALLEGFLVMTRVGLRPMGHLWPRCHLSINRCSEGSRWHCDSECD